MYVSMIILIVLMLLLVILVSFRYRFNISRFELKRRAEHGREFKEQYQFQMIYPGMRALCMILALVVAVAICSVAFYEWQFIGALIALGTIMLALLLSRSLGRVAQELIEKNLAWFNKYFAWTEILGRISFSADEPHVNSRQELLHMIEKSDFMNDDDQRLVSGALNLSEIKLIDIMTPRNKIVPVESSEAIGPKLIDELHSSGHKVFPVVKGSLDDIVGTLYLDDVTIIDRATRTLGDAMRPSLPMVNRNQTLVEVLGQMAKQNSVVVLVIDDKGKVVGLVSLGDIVRVLIKN